MYTVPVFSVKHCRVVLEGTETPGIDIWHSICDVLARMDIPTNKFTDDDGNTTSRKKIERDIRQTRLGQSCCVADLRLDFGTVGKFERQGVWINDAQDRGDRLDRFIEEFSKFEMFVMAWTVDHDYDHWQNVTSTQTYDLEGRDYSQLPLVDNGLPFPLNQMDVDTSNNPGRWVHRHGYVEAVSAQMWFSDRFWKLTGSNWRDLQDVEGIEIEDQGGSVIKMTAYPKLFTSSEGEEADIQGRLRWTLYPVSRCQDQ